MKMKKILSLLLGFCLLASSFVLPDAGFASLNSSDDVSFDTSNGFNKGITVANPNGEDGDNVLKIPYESEASDGPAFVPAADYEDYVTYQFDIYFDKFNTSKPQNTWRILQGEEVRSTVSDGVTTYSIGGNWINLGSVSAGSDENNAVIRDRFSNSTTFSVQSKTWYTLRYNVDTVKGSVALFAGRKGEELEAVESVYSSSAAYRYLDSYRCLIEDHDRGKNIVISDDKLSYTENGYQNLAGRLQFIRTVGTAGEAMDAAGSNDTYIDNFKVRAYTPFYIAVNNASTSAHVREVLDLYTECDVFDYGTDYITYGADLDIVCKELAGMTFASDDEVISAYNESVESFNLEPVTYTEVSTFDDGNNSFSKTTVIDDPTVNAYGYSDRAGNKIFSLESGGATYTLGKVNGLSSKTIDEGIVKLELEWFGDWYNGSSDEEYNDGEDARGTTSYYGHSIQVVTDQSRQRLLGIVRDGSWQGHSGWASPKALKHQWQDVKICLNLEDSSVISSFAPLGSDEYTFIKYMNYASDGSYTNEIKHYFDGLASSDGKNTNGYISGPVKSFTMNDAYDVLDNWVDNICITAYQPFYKIMSRAKTASAVKSLCELYGTLGAFDPTTELEYDVDYDAVYAQMANRTYDSSAEVQSTYLVLCEENQLFPECKIELSARMNGEECRNAFTAGALTGIAKVTNYTDAPLPITLVTAQYTNSGKLIGVNMTKDTVSENTVKSVTCDLTIEDASDSNAKIMAFSSMDLKPLTSALKLRESVANNAADLFLVGDSLCQTYTDWYAPMQGWGYYLPDYVSENLTVHNYGHSGWTTADFLNPDKTDSNKITESGTSEWDGILSQLSEGDWCIIALGINDASQTNEARTTEEEYVANLTKMTNEARAKGANVIFSTPTIAGGSDNSASGWQFNESHIWAARGLVMAQVGEDLGVTVIRLGETLSEVYEQMYSDYMEANPDATVAEGRNYVRYHFHLYMAHITASVEEGGLGLDGFYKNEDDSTHMNYIGANTTASVIAELIYESDSVLGDYMNIK